MDKLSEHFSLAEAVISQTGARAGIDNTPPPDVLANMQKAASKLEGVRDFLNHPIIVSSWYRCPLINQKVGGRPLSAHTWGWAIDFTCPGFGTPLKIAQALERKFNYDQLIHEYGTWVHISFDPRQRNEEWTIDHNGTRPGLLEIK